MSEKREHWSGNWGFLMALAGSAIGLGNIWKFPYVTGKYGGGAFVLVYLCCIMVIGLPILIGELTIGRTTGLNPIGAFAALCPKRSKLADLLGGIILLSGIALITFSQIGYGILVMLLGAVILYGGWKAIGLISGVITPFLILGYYGVVGGWTLIYAVKAVTGNLAFKTAAEAQAAFTPIQQAAPGTWWYVIGGQLAFMTLCGIILWFGVKKGIERCSKVLMPSLFVLLIVLILRSISLPGASAGIKFFLSPDFSKLSAEAVLVALGQAFYTLSLGMGISIVYGSYVRKETNLPKSVLQLIGLDTMVAMMAGLAIFPAVFAMGFEPAAGEGLVFQILPTAFNMIPGGLGSVWSSFFFIAVSIAALTSGISLMEVIVSVLIDYFKMKRWAAVLFSWSSISILGVFCSISMNSWKNIPWMEKGLTTLPDRELVSPGGGHGGFGICRLGLGCAQCRERNPQRRRARTGYEFLHPAFRHARRVRLRRLLQTYFHTGVGLGLFHPFHHAGQRHVRVPEHDGSHQVQLRTKFRRAEAEKTRISFPPFPIPSF